MKTRKLPRIVRNSAPCSMLTATAGTRRGAAGGRCAGAARGARDCRCLVERDQYAFSLFSSANGVISTM